MAEAENPTLAVVAELKRLNEAVVSRQLDVATATTVAAQLASITASLQVWPEYAKREVLGVQNRISSFLETGQWPAAPPDGSEIDFDIASPVGGIANPVSVGATYFRDGDEAVGRVTVGRCFEGPPERVHGGIICAIFDEVMGSVFRATGTASAFTGELVVRFQAPAPILTDLEFRARQVGQDGRKRFLEGEASSADGQFASATATFVEMRREHLE